MNSNIANDLDQILTVLAQHFGPKPVPPEYQFVRILLGIVGIAVMFWAMNRLRTNTSKDPDQEAADTTYWKMIRARYEAAIDDIDEKYSAVIARDPTQQPRLSRTSRKASPHDSGWLYLIKGRDAYKIGIAINPEARLSKLQTSTHDKLELVHKTKVDDMREVELSLHQKYASKRIRGEWFKLSDEDVKSICALTSESAEVAL